ncbi:acyl-CoA dehydrogenase/oxidase [Dichotomocladium elegans]|nr:acyl-CoA dehydrogenase/oxidase [Dichotomocladium elegans]
MSLQAPKDMAEERAAAEFDIEALARLYAGGDRKYELQCKAFEIIRTDPELIVQPPRNILEFSREEWREYTMGQIYRIAELLQTRFKDDPELGAAVAMAVGHYSPSFSMRVFVHQYLFRNVLTMLGTKEQCKIWMDDIDHYRIYGCFAMTELGHSSALQDIETTATYDQQTDEFVIESPNITSTKWWIGGSAQTSTHAVVICKTVINGANVGHNWFVVQLREKSTGELMPNVKIGDIGKKHGHQGVDNGWIQFHRVRIPRLHMLQKWVTLERDGSYTPAPSPAVMYATLIPERLTLIQGTTNLAGQALTIATRYGVVRRQGHQNQQIMDYQSHYAQIIPLLAFLHILNSASGTIYDQYDVLTAGGEMDPADFLNHMSDMHAISACLKGMAGWYGSEILEVARRACGGHAYSAYNGISQIINDWGVMTTGAGDNVVLLQQAARIYIRQLHNKLERNEYPKLKFKSSTHYFLRAKEYLADPVWSVENVAEAIKDLRILEDVLFAILTKRVRIGEGKRSEDLLMDMVRAAELHCAAFLFSDAVSKYGSPRAPAGVDAGAYGIMRRLTALWGIHTLCRYSDQGFKEGYLLPRQVKEIEEVYYEATKALRKQVIGISDAFNFPDFILKSPIAKYDGDIYEAYFDTLLQRPNSIGKAPYHDRYIKPLTSRVAPDQPIKR